ncbi:MAG TPA: site-specific integrase [Planctomycetota bacterium]|jgi:integrase
MDDRPLTKPPKWVKVNPHQPPNRPGWCVIFVHPLSQKTINKGLETRDEGKANDICRDLERLVNHPEFWDPKHPVCSTLEPKAFDIFFGKGVKRPEPLVAIKGGADPAASFLSLRPLFDEVQYESKELAEERRLRAEREKEIVDLKRANADLLYRAETLHRESGKHVTITLGEAVDEWKVSYPKGRSESTVTAATAVLENFVCFVGASKPLVKVRPGDIDGWVETYRGREHKCKRHSKRNFNEQPLSPSTKRKVRAYVSSFFSWAFRKYELPENPMERLAPIPGVARHPENIKAIRHYDDLITLLDSLKPWPYWRAWIGVACLAGPRWSEQAWLKVSDVYLDNGYIRITSRASGARIIGTKTGRERNIPIEKTQLHDILKEQVQLRIKERKQKEATVAQASDWLFPSTLGDNPNMPRKKTLPGLWSGTKAFTSGLAPVIEAAKASVNGTGEFWDYGADEWRHCFGTSLGHSGFSTLEISSYMGNSEAVARRHYVAPPGGKRWPLKWH